MKLHLNTPAPQAKTICDACLHDTHLCFACGGAAPSDPTAPGLVKCGLAACGRCVAGSLLVLTLGNYCRPEGTPLA